MVPTLGILLTNWFQWSSPHPRLGGVIHSPFDCLDKRREGSSCFQRPEQGQTLDFDGNVIKKASPSSVYIKSFFPQHSASCPQESHHLLEVGSLGVSGICSFTFPAAPGLLGFSCQSSFHIEMLEPMLFYVGSPQHPPCLDGAPTLFLGLI